MTTAWSRASSRDTVRHRTVTQYKLEGDLTKQRSRDYPIDVPAKPTRPDITFSSRLAQMDRKRLPWLSAMTARSKLRGQKKESPLAPVESILVAKVSIRECRCCGDIDQVVT